MRFAAVVLAAGKSERMGRNKLLLEIRGQTVLDILLDVLDSSNIDEVFVVIGHRPEDLISIIEKHRAEVVFNPNYSEGMISSFQVGLGKVTSEAVFLVLGDQLWLDCDLLNKMKKKMESDPGALIVSPLFEGRRGHPVLFRRNLFPEIMSLGKHETLKDVVRRHESGHRIVKGDIFCVLDFDTPKEFEKAKKLFQTRIRVSS